MPPLSDPSPTDLAAFIRSHIEPLLAEWDRFAGTLTGGRLLDAQALRDHAREILLAVAHDMATEQSDQQQSDKSQGLRPENSPSLNTAAAMHGVARMAEHFSLDDLAVEFRALRASVLRSLASSGTPASIVEITRFNESIDQVLAVSIGTYARQVAQAQEVRRESEMRRQLLQHAQVAQDADRRRIAQELHDSFGQKLTALSLSVLALARLAGDEAGQQEAQRARSLLDAAERELDDLVFQLRPIDLAGFSFAEALSAHVASWSAMTGVTVDLVADALGDGALPEPVESGVFRVIQEALNNVAKHAQARRVSITMRRAPRLLTGSIEDDGVGFDAARSGPAVGPGQAGWGLLGMRERIEALGGSFQIESAPGEGCALLLRVPLPQ